MAIISNITIKYENWVNKNYGSPLGKKGLYNDDVSCPTISPDFYMEFIYPVEKKLEEEYGGFSYWHSCGNCDELLKSIRGLNIDTMNLSMVGDIEKYIKILGNDKAYEICVHPINHVLNADTITMFERTEKIISICDKENLHSYSIIASALEGTGKNNIISDLKQIFKCLEITCKKVNNI